jgi:hypothetical protein
MFIQSVPVEGGGRICKTAGELFLERVNSDVTKHTYLYPTLNIPADNDEISFSK